jgi:hypothetical protein
LFFTSINNFFNYIFMIFYREREAYVLVSLGASKMLGPVLTVTMSYHFLQYFDFNYPV